MKKLTVMKIMIMSMVISMMMSSCKKIETAKLVENTETKQTNETEIKNFEEEVITTTETESFEEIEIETEEEKVASPSEPNWPDEKEWNTCKPLVMDFINNGYKVYLNVEDCKYENLEVGNIIMASYLYKLVENKDISIVYGSTEVYDDSDRAGDGKVVMTKPILFKIDFNGFPFIPKNYQYAIEYKDENMIVIDDLNREYKVTKLLRNDKIRQIVSPYDDELYCGLQDWEDNGTEIIAKQNAEKAAYAASRTHILEEGVDYWLSYEYPDDSFVKGNYYLDKEVDKNRRYLTLIFNNTIGDGWLSGTIVSRGKEMSTNNVINIPEDFTHFLDVVGFNSLYEHRWFSKGIHKINLESISSRFKDLSLPNAYRDYSHRNANPDDFRVWFEGLTLNRY